MATQQPTGGELQILRVLWGRGPSTVREILSELPKGTGYTTVLKLMQIMFEKGLLLRDEKSRTHVYRPAIPQERTLRTIAADLLDRAFGGSASKLLLAALSARRVSPEELAELRRLVDEAAARSNSMSSKSKG